VEAQRIILISIKRPDLANYADDNNMCFDCQEPCEANPNIDINKRKFNDVIARALSSYLEKRSAFPSFLEKRAFLGGWENNVASENVSAKDYWLEQGPKTGSFIQTSVLPKELAAIGSLPAIYAGLKLKAAGYSPAQIFETFISKPWLRALVGGGVMVALMNKLIGNATRPDPYVMRPATEYGNVLQDTQFSGHLQKYSSLDNSLGLSAGAIVLPSAYIMNSYNQPSLVEKKIMLFS
jgi:hypothetical protein